MARFAAILVLDWGSFMGSGWLTHWSVPGVSTWRRVCRKAVEIDHLQIIIACVSGMVDSGVSDN